MRLQDRPRWKVSAGVEFADLATGATAVRALAQSGLFPTNCRLLDVGEALLSARLTPGGARSLVLGFESGRPPRRGADGESARALRRPRRHAARTAPSTDGSGPGPAVAEGTPAPRRLRRPGRHGGSGGCRRRVALLLPPCPYTRDALVRLGMICETFETSCTWDRFHRPARVGHRRRWRTRSPASAVRDGSPVGSPTPTPTVSPPYFSVLAPGRPGLRALPVGRDQVGRLGGAARRRRPITHHHAVVGHHRPSYDRAAPRRLRGPAALPAKLTLDPAASSIPARAPRASMGGSKIRWRGFRGPGDGRGAADPGASGPGHNAVVDPFSNLVLQFQVVRRFAKSAA